MANGIIRLIVADDHGMIIAGIKDSFAGTNISVIDSTNDPHSVIALYQLHKPDIVLCDIRFGVDFSGIEVLKQLLAFDKNVKVVLYTQFDDHESILTAYKIGVRAFITKGTDLNALVNCLNEVHSGERHFEPSIAVKYAKGLFSSATEDKPASNEDVLSLLNDKELAVFRLSARLTSQEVAERMQFTTRTISSINSSIRLKLNIDLHERKALKDAAVDFLKYEQSLSDSNTDSQSSDRE